MDYVHFLDAATDRAAALVAAYDPLLVALSFLPAVLGSYAALGTAGRMGAASRTLDRWVWLTVGTLAMGGGVWAMHFIGMLAYRLPVPVGYDPATILFSMVPAALAGGIALHVMARPDVGTPRLVIGGGLMGAGIAAMHYTGMAALRMGALVRYDPVLFALSIVVAVVLATTALYIAFRLRRRLDGRHERRLTVAGALVMGLAMTGMHYTAMRAAYCFAAPGGVDLPGALDPKLLDFTVGFGVLLLIALAIVAVIVGRRLETAHSVARASRNLLHDSIESIADGIVLFDADDRFVLCNSGYREAVAGLEHLLVPGTPFEDLVRASVEAGPIDPRSDDVEAYVARRLACHRDPGEPFEQKHKSGRWVLITERRTGDGGTVIVRTDITEHKRAEQALQQANQRLEQRVAERTDDLSWEMTERERAEEALRRSERRFRNLVEGSVQGILIHRDRHPLYVNEAWAEVHGFTVGEILAMDSVAHLIAERDQARMADYRKRRILGEDLPTRYEYEAVRKDGTHIWLENRTNVVTWNDEPAILSAIVDITEHKRTEEALRQSDERFRGAIETLQEGFALYDADDRLVLCNEEYRRLHPKTADILKPGMLFETLVRANIEHGTNADALGREEEHVRERLEQHRNPVGSIVRHLTDGSWFIIKENRTPDGGIVVIETDITEHKRTEEALRESEERFRAVVDNSPTKIHIKDLHGRYLLINRQSELLFGVTNEEALGKTSREIFPKEVADSFMGHDQRVIDTRQTIEEEEKWVRDDGVHTYLTVKFPVFGADGAVAAVGAIGTDITDRKKAMEEIHRLNATLEERVARRTAELEAANKELEAFSYSVSHDLRGPLRTIDGFSRILLEEYAEALDDEGRGYLARVRAGSQKMGELIDAILTLSRLTRNELKRGELDLSAVAGAIAAELTEANPDRDLTFRIAPGVTAVGDEQLIRVALQNLLGNAVKYTGHTDKAEVEFGMTNGNGRPVYFVRDNGAGFDMTYANKLFAPFQRIHGPKEFEGTGIGLATVKRIINRHSGRVWAEAEVDKGATFYFTL